MNEKLHEARCTNVVSILVAKNVLCPFNKFNRLIFIIVEVLREVSSSLSSVFKRISQVERTISHCIANREQFYVSKTVFL